MLRVSPKLGVKRESGQSKAPHDFSPGALRTPRACPSVASSTRRLSRAARCVVDVAVREDKVLTCRPDNACRYVGPLLAGHDHHHLPPAINTLANQHLPGSSNSCRI